MALRYTYCPVAGNRFISRWFLRILALSGCLLAAGCLHGPYVVPEASRRVIDRRITEYPAGYELKPFMTGLTCPTAICFDDSSGDLIVAEGGVGGRDPKILGIKPDGTQFYIYPVGTRLPLVGELGFRIYGTVGGMAARNGKIYVSHRDSRDMGVITEFDLSGNHRTVIADLPAQGDYGVTDIAIPPAPVEPRLYFGVGAATNSGVVGLDNWEEGWVRTHRDACDLPYQTLNLQGFRFDVPNPEASIFSPSSLVTVPFEPLGTSNVIQIPGVQFPVQKPTGFVGSVAVNGGDLRVEAWGVRNPAGIVVDEYGTIFLTDQGMELRGTRPIDNDPDVMFQLSVPGQWLGYPDFSRTGESVGQGKYQPPTWMVIPSGYPKVGPVLDYSSTKLSFDTRALRAVFPWQSGAEKIAFFPKSGSFHNAQFEGQALVAMWGDRAPFSTSGRPIPTPLPGYGVMRVDLLTGGVGQVSPFIYNTGGGPSSKCDVGRGEGIERPIDVKFGPDGNLYILDFGQAVFKNGQLKASGGTGKILILEPAPKDSTK